MRAGNTVASKIRLLKRTACSAVLLMVSLNAAADSYTYDALGRLTSVINDNNITTYYCYDKSGNRTAIQSTPCP